MKLYVGNLPFSARDEELRELFAQYGEVSRANVVMDKESGRSRGFGFVEYEDSEQAKAAVTALNGRDWKGRALVVNEARAQGAGGGERRGPRGGGGGYGGGFGGGYGGGYGDSGGRGGRGGSGRGRNSY
ncbi:MAG: RNA-binding protein [Acidobacteriota bacterium]